MTASSFLHPPLVAPDQRAQSWVPVLRRWPRRAFGVIRSAGLVTRPAEVWAHGPGSSLTERLALQGWPLLSGSLSFRIRSCLQALTVCISLFVPCRAYPIRLTGAL